MTRYMRSRYMSMYTSPKFIPNKVDKPIFYKKCLNAYRGAFFGLAVIATMVAAGFFYYG